MVALVLIETQSRINLECRFLYLLSCGSCFDSHLQATFELSLELLAQLCKILLSFFQLQLHLESGLILKLLCLVFGRFQHTRLALGDSSSRGGLRVLDAQICALLLGLLILLSQLLILVVTNLAYRLGGVLVQ